MGYRKVGYMEQIWYMVKYKLGELLRGGEPMPSRPKRPCSYPGCPNLTDGQYCEQHAAIARKQYNKYERSPDINKKYGRAWKRIRDRHIAQHPLCERCEKEGRLVPAQEVHHKIPIS